MRFTEHDCLVHGVSGVSDRRLVQLRACILTAWNLIGLVDDQRFLKASFVGLEMRGRVIVCIQFASAVLDPETDLSGIVGIILLRLINMCKFSLILTYDLTLINFWLLLIFLDCHHWHILFNQRLSNTKLLHKGFWRQICIARECFTQIHILNIQFSLLFP